MGLYGGLNGDSGNSRYFDFSEYGEVKFFKIKKAGEYAFDFIPFKATSKNNPLVANGDAKMGDMIPFMMFNVHRNIGPMQKAVICPGSIGKPCPICEEAENWKREKGYNSAEYKALKPTQRVIFNMVDADDDDDEVTIFETSQFLFAKELFEEADIQAKKHGQSIDEYDFAGAIDPANAKTVTFRASTEKGPTGEYFKYKGFSFDKRTKKLSKVTPVPLDKCMIIKSYDELQAMFHGAEVEAEAEEEAPPPARQKPVVRDDADDDAPPTRTKRKPDRDEDEEKPTPECPAKNGTFGDDFGEFKQCDKCEIYAECQAESAKRK